MAKSKDAEPKDGEEKAGGMKKLIIIVVPVLLVVVLAAVYFLFLKPKPPTAEAAAATGSHAKTSAKAETTGEATADTAGEAAAAPTPTSTYLEGAVVKTDPISINLAGGHYLKLGLALQASKTAGEEVPPAKALDAAIALFSNRTIDELSTLKGREKLKSKLVEHLKEIYEDKVYDVYFTEFVMQ